jgi:hypothetical protein
MVGVWRGNITLLRLGFVAVVIVVAIIAVVVAVISVVSSCACLLGAAEGTLRWRSCSADKHVAASSS